MIQEQVNTHYQLKKIDWSSVVDIQKFLNTV